MAGFRFIWSCQAVLGAMSFDLIATLFGGVNALLPIYARDILDIGPWGAGILRSAPAVGALLVGRGAGALSGARATAASSSMWALPSTALGAIVFGLSTNVALSIAALMVLGCGDMMSSVVRQTIVQMTTPDEMRGRVVARQFVLHRLTAGQLGAFRAGLMAALIGAVGSVVVGGCAVFVTVALWIWLFPALAPRRSSRRSATVLIARSTVMRSMRAVLVLRIAATACAVVGSLAPLLAQAQDDVANFYKGKTIAAAGRLRRRRPVRRDRAARSRATWASTFPASPRWWCRTSPAAAG